MQQFIHSPVPAGAAVVPAGAAVVSAGAAVVRAPADGSAVHVFGAEASPPGPRGLVLSGRRVVWLWCVGGSEVVKLVRGGIDIGVQHEISELRLTRQQTA